MVVEDKDAEVARKVAEGASIMVRKYIREMRRQGRIKGKLRVRVKDGKRITDFPFAE